MISPSRDSRDVFQTNDERHSEFLESEFKAVDDNVIEGCNHKGILSRL